MLLLNSCEQSDVQSVAPEQTNSENIFAAAFASSETPLLENKLHLLNEKQSRKWIVPEIRYYPLLFVMNQPWITF